MMYQCGRCGLTRASSQEPMGLSMPQCKCPWEFVPPVAPQHQQSKQEPVAWNETRSKVIKALAAIVTVHTPDNLFDLDAIPREPVMHLVQQIKVAVYEYKPPQRQPLTDEEIADAVGWNVEAGGKALPREIRIARAIETAHGIKGEA